MKRRSFRFTDDNGFGDKKRRVEAEKLEITSLADLKSLTTDELAQTT